MTGVFELCPLESNTQTICRTDKTFHLFQSGQSSVFPDTPTSVYTKVISELCDDIKSKSTMICSTTSWLCKGYQQIFAEFVCSIDSHACVHSALFAKKHRLIVDWIHRLVPNVRVDLNPKCAVEVKCYKIFGFDIIPRKCQEGHKGVLVLWIKHLATVGMVVGLSH